VEPFICMGCNTRVVAKVQPSRCLKCGKGSGFLKPFSEASYTLAGMESADKERSAARATAEREAMEERLKSAKGDIAARAGEMERNSPLFFGTGDNPSLFG
jgi:hypothetical protein